MTKSAEGNFFFEVSDVFTNQSPHLSNLPFHVHVAISLNYTGDLTRW